MRIRRKTVHTIYAHPIIIMHRRAENVQSALTRCQSGPPFSPLEATAAGAHPHHDPSQGLAAGSTTDFDGLSRRHVEGRKPLQRESEKVIEERRRACRKSKGCERCVLWCFV